MIAGQSQKPREIEAPAGLRAYRPRHSAAAYSAERAVNYGGSVAEPAPRAAPQESPPSFRAPAETWGHAGAAAVEDDQASIAYRAESDASEVEADILSDSIPSNGAPVLAAHAEGEIPGFVSTR